MTLDTLKPYKNILLLQGPMGEFFTRFGRYLRKRDHRVLKINLNGGDLLFYPGPDAHSFHGTPDTWQDFLRSFIVRHDVNAICLFSDCTIYHRLAVNLAAELNIPAFILEHGYIRPNYITFERHGVNAYSRVPRDQSFYLSLPDGPEPDVAPVNPKFLWTATVAIVYQLACLFLKWKYPHFNYHKQFSYVSEPYFWLRSFIRRIPYGIRERSVLHLIQGRLQKKYFLVPLQVHNDSQILVHSDYVCISEFIDEVLESFAKNASPKHCLIFKHHPMDRGHTDYSDHIRQVSRRWGIEHRVLYVHDLHLPTLLRNAIGTVVINSTVGISSLFHNTPVKATGRALYNFSGMTYQDSLDLFWKRPGRVRQDLNQRFRRHIIETTQINAHFFGRSPFSEHPERQPLMSWRKQHNS